MQISKAFLFLCPALLCVAPLSLSAADNEAQIKAREALEKMQPTQPSAAAPVVAQEQPKAVKPAPAPKPAPEPVKLVPPPAPVKAPAPAPAPVAVQAMPVLELPTPADEASLQKAREAMRQKMAELNASEPPAVAEFQPLSIPQAADAAAIEKARGAERQKVDELNASEPPVVAEFQPLPAAPGADPAVLEKARETVREQLSLLPAPESTAGKSALPKGMPQFEPLQGPPLPISTEKQALLAVLLQKYRADLITPDQYQSERAKILAQ